MPDSPDAEPVPPAGRNAAERLRAFGGRASRDDALALFDELPPVAVPQLLGSWKGEGLATGNPLDGLLEAFGWHGKRFDSPEDAHPLVFRDQHGRFSVDPAAVPVSLVTRLSSVLHHDLVATVANRSLRVLRTRKPKARLRMMEHRGVVTGTMTYDALPVNDHFRAVDRDTLLAVMDLRGLELPFLFVLRRETGAQPG